MTTVTIRLRDQTARALTARAAHEGRSLDALIADLAEQGAASPHDDLMALLAPLPLLSPEALSRDSIYGEPPGTAPSEALREADYECRHPRAPKAGAAHAGIQSNEHRAEPSWIPAFAGMTAKRGLGFSFIVSL